MSNPAPSVLDGVKRLTQIAGRNRLELLLFALAGDQVYGINVFKVREVIRCPSLTKIPDSKMGVCGLASIRGQTILVLDLSLLIGSTALTNLEKSFVVVAEYNRHTIGFLVGDVKSIVNKNWEEVKPPPASLGSSSFLTAVTTVDKKLVEILDVERVLQLLIGDDEISFDDMATGNIEDVQAEVFIIDDSMVARKQLTQTMDQLGVQYQVAKNGREALELLRTVSAESDVPMSERFAMIISDIEMPEMDGYALTCEIRADPSLADMYVCLHTSLSGSFNKAMAEKVGADKLIPKFNPNDIASLVRDRIGLHVDVELES